MKAEQLTKENFEAYEVVRESGVTNMLDVNVVCSLSGLDRETVFAVLKNYSELNERFPGVRK